MSDYENLYSLDVLRVEDKGENDHLDVYKEFRENILRQSYATIGIKLRSRRFLKVSSQRQMNHRAESDYKMLNVNSGRMNN